MTTIARPLLILTFAVLVTLCCGSCDTPTVYIMGGDRDTDSDTDVNSDSPVEADREFVDADVDLDDMTDGDLPPDGDEDLYLPGEVTIIINNRSPQAAYVKYIYGDKVGLGNGGITVLDKNGDTIVTHPGCTAPCGEECVEIACDQPIPRLRQILPGESITLTWEGGYYSYEECETEYGNTARCHRRHPVIPGEHKLRFCHSLRMIVDDNNLPTRRGMNTLENAYVADPVCVELPLLVEAGPVTKHIYIDPLPEYPPKEPGYCGQMWSYSIEQPNMSLQGEPYSVDQGSSPVFLMRPQFDESPPCYRFGEVMHTVQEDEHKVYVHAAVWKGLRECEGGAYEAPLHALVLPPLNPGDWTALFGSYATPQTHSHDFTINPCPSCVECPDGEFGSYGDRCSADCGCIDQGAVCGNNVSCMNYCLSPDDCPPGHDCSYSPYTAAAVWACTPLTEHNCVRSEQCPPGYTCAEDGSRYIHCMPDMDTRVAAENQGRGIACGCDAECPGMQSCVRFEEFFPDGFCAFICRDNRDCPENWQCIGMTQSGMASICMPPWED